MSAPVTVDSLRPDTKNVNLNGVKVGGAMLSQKLKIVSCTCLLTPIFQVVDAKVVLDRFKGPKGGSLRVAECLVADHTGSIILTVKNEQGEHTLQLMLVLWLSETCPVSMAVVDTAVKGAVLNLGNARVDMHRGTMRLAVESVEGCDLDVQTNVSPLPCTEVLPGSLWLGRLDPANVYGLTIACC
jgi:hypothetical protein